VGFFVEFFVAKKNKKINLSVTLREAKFIYKALSRESVTYRNFGVRVSGLREPAYTGIADAMDGIQRRLAAKIEAQKDD
jgi:hypothetical protein